jgi:2-phospho-L-lactate guanylyltransferase
VRAIALPVRSLEESKSRLGPICTPLERAALTLAMLEDVIDETERIAGWQTWVISPDETVLELATGRGVHTLTEERGPLGNAVRQVEEEAAARDVEALAVLLPDTPLMSAWALTKALHTLGPVVLAPSADELGTNLLVRRPPAAIQAHFGADSYRRHLESAAERGLPSSIVELADLAFDLDVPSDILTVLETRRPGRTLEVCRELELGSRIPIPNERGVR